MKQKTKTSILSGIALFSVMQIQAQKQPNFLFILADDLGYYDMGYNGSKYYETPNIDRLAKQSMIFTNGYAACQVCSPSRASIMTGKFPARHGITDYIGAKSGEDWRSNNRHSLLLPSDYLHNLPKEYTTLPEALKQAGYTTFFAGKWHLGSVGSYPEDHGFDFNVGGCEAGGPVGGYFSPFENPKLTDGPNGEELSMRLANETVKFLQSNKEKPFFAYLAFYAVHSPIQTTKEKWEKYRSKAEQMGVSPSGFVMEKRLPIRQHQDNPIYAGLLEAMDDAIGVVINQLKVLGLDKNTIIIFTGDNGGVSSGDAFSTSNLPFRGGKGYQWEGGIREPYLISVPWMKENYGKKTDMPATGTDFYPTILDLAGLNLRPNDHNDGISLLPALQEKKITERSLIWHYPHYGNQGGDPTSIIRKGNWKLIHYWEDDHNELYDLSSDVVEKYDVSTQNKALTEQLWNELNSYLTSVNASIPQKDREYDAAQEAIYMNGIVTKKLPNLEKERTQMLSKNWSPNKDWWGSLITND